MERSLEVNSLSSFVYTAAYPGKDTHPLEICQISDRTDEDYSVLQLHWH